MLILGTRRFIKAPFASEAELERVVVENYENLFGPNSFYLPKSKIETAGGFGTIPDGFAIDIAEKKWYVVEAELVHHGLWTHIVPQITKQLVASQLTTAKRKIIDLSVAQYKVNPQTKEKFDDYNIQEVNVHGFIENILATDPIVGLPIDGWTDDLRDWTKTLKHIVKIWQINKFVELNSPGNIVYEFPEEFKPTLDTEHGSPLDEGERNITTYDVSIQDLIEGGLIHPGEKLTMPYKPRNGQANSYEAVVNEDGTLIVDGQLFFSPTYAALYGIQHSGSTRQTVNGWTKWRNADGELLASLRDRYLKDRS